MKYTFCTLLFAAVLFSACNKEGFSDNTAEKCKIVTVKRTSGKYVDNASITYDSKGDVASLVSSQDSAFRSFVVKKEPNKIVLVTKYDGNYVYDLDGNNRVIKATIGDWGGKFEFTYSADGYISSMVQRFSNWPVPTNFNFYYSDGNLVKVTFSESIGGYTTNTEIVYTYLKTEIAALLIEETDPLSFVGSYGYQPLLLGFYGKANKNLMESAKVTRASSTGYVEGNHTSYVYKKDAQGNINSVDITRSGFLTNYSFIYNCN